MAVSMLKIRRPLGRLIFNMGIAIPGKTVFLIETAPRKLMEGIEILHNDSTYHQVDDDEDTGAKFWNMNDNHKNDNAIYDCTNSFL